MKAKISEIFESIQGEGPYTGEKQVFVRFFGCNLSCSFCDTPLVHFKEYSIGELREESLRFSGYHSLSLTGGEPLCQADFLKDFLESIRDLKIKTYLETNGTLPEELKKIIDDIDIISMDFKLPSSTRAQTLWQQHEDFLKVSSRKKVFVKMVITQETKEDDILKAGSVIKKVDPNIAAVLQPAWLDMSRELFGKMELFKGALVSNGVVNVRILAQMHKLAGIK